MTESIEQQLRARARALLSEGAIDLFIGYRQGSSPLRAAPFVARTPTEAERLIWSPVCVPNLAGTLQKHAGRRVGVALKGCDARSVHELLGLRQLARERLHIIGVVCTGMADAEQVGARAPAAVTAITLGGEELVVEAGGGAARHALGELLLPKCRACADHTPRLYDELLGEPATAAAPADRFERVRALEELGAPGRLAFWSEQLSRCTLCYACQTVCPLCYCKSCSLTLARDDPRREARAPMTVFTYHLMRAYHLAERCTGCDECERVCPENIPLSLICRKIEQERVSAPVGDPRADHERGPR